MVGSHTVQPEEDGDVSPSEDEAGLDTRSRTGVVLIITVVIEIEVFRAISILMVV